jgi:hypothetical protein
VGEGSSFKICFCPTRRQDEENDSGGESEIVGEIEDVLGGEEKVGQAVMRRFPLVFVSLNK